MLNAAVQGHPLLLTSPLSNPKSHILHSNGLPHRHRSIRHTKVRRNRPLTTNTTSRSSLGTGQAREDTHIQNTVDLLNLPRKRVDLPNAVLARTILAIGDIGLGQEGLEGGVDEEEVLVRLEGSLLGVLVGANDGVNGAEFEEFVEDAVGGDGGDFDGDVFPVGEEAGLEFARVWKVERGGVCQNGDEAFNSRISVLLGLDLPATQMNCLACIATIFSWKRQAPPPLMQFKSSSTSSAPSNATSSTVPAGRASNSTAVNPALMISWRD